MSHTRCKIVVFPAFALPIISTRILMFGRVGDDPREAMTDTGCKERGGMERKDEKDEGCYQWTIHLTAHCTALHSSHKHLSRRKTKNIF